jgi:predicted 3-demethylubiquinone-9 3-methyltransferase (glyoxalase superfamily)
MPSKHERKMQKFDKYVAEMRAAGCVVIAYSPDDVRNAITYQLADSMSDHKFEFHPDVDLMQVAQDTHEDDTLWDAISEAVGFAYGRAVAETHFGLEREEVN